MSKRKRNAYDNSFKIRVIEFAENSNNCAAEREFGISEKLVRDWRKNKTKICDGPKSQKRRVIRISPYEPLENDLNDWILELRASGYVVTRNGIRVKALQLAKDPKYKIQGEFKASSGWCCRFMNRHGLAIRQKTHIAQKLPNDVENKVLSFHQFVIKERREFDFELSQIGNMDETPMFFDLPGNSTVHTIGDKTVSIKTSGHDKTHFTVILACLADGTKLKPAVVFKRKTMPKDKFPSGIIVYVQEKGWVDDNIMQKWISDVWCKRPGGLLRTKSLMVWDQFRAHLTDKVKRTMKENGTRQAVIPGGCTSLLQPLDVCLNKPLKGHIRRFWNEWMVNGPKETTAKGNLKRPSLPTVCDWVIRAWNEIRQVMVMKSFLKCGISNSLDGTEDDELYNDFTQDKCSDQGDQSTHSESESDLDDSYVYGDGLTDEQLRELFQSDDDESDFEGF